LFERFWETLKQSISKLSNNQSTHNGFPSENEIMRWAEPDLNRRPLARKALNAQCWLKFTQYVYAKYAKSYCKTIMSYSKRFHHLVFSENLQEIELLPATIRNNAIKSLVILSKFLGFYKKFSERLKAFDIKTTRPDTLNAFLRILNASNSDVLLWYNEIKPSLRENEKLFEVSFALWFKSG
jgi:hypothetical protein